MLCALSCEAQAQEARIIERLADGSYVVQINGVEHRALSAEKIIQLAEQRVQFKACQDAAVLKDEKLVLLDKQVAALNEVIKQLAAQPKRSKLGSTLGFLLNVGEVGWRIYATAK